MSKRKLANTRGLAQSSTLARPPQRRRALLASTAFTGAFIAVIAGQPQSALAACQGVNTGNVLCDLANQATAGTLNTTFNGSTVVNVNPGAKINGGAGATANITAPGGDLIFNNNDTTFGITSNIHGVALTNNFGAITYVGNANVTAGNVAVVGIVGLAGAAGDLTITNNATVFGADTAIRADHTGTGSVLINGTGTIQGGGNGVNAIHSGAGPAAGFNGIAITGSGTVLAPGSVGISASITNATNASNILIDRSGSVSAGFQNAIVATTNGTGNITVTGSGSVTGGDMFSITPVNGITAKQTNNAVGTNGSVAVGGSGNVNATGIGIDAEVTQGNNAGSVTVNRTGSITSSGDTGILGRASGGGNVTVSGVGAISGIRGIQTATVGSGTSTVIISNDVTGTLADGVTAGTQAGLNTVTVTGGTVSGFGPGISAGTNTGANIVTIGAGAKVQGNTGVSLSGPTSTVVNSGTITGVNFGINNGAGSTTVINAGSIAGGFRSVLLGGANNLIVLDGPNATLTGSAQGSGTDTFRFAGSGSNSFDVSQINTGWTLLDKTGSSNWTLTGTSTTTAAVTVNGGRLSVNGNLASASSMTVNGGGTLGGTGTVGNTTINPGGALAPGNSIGTINISGNLSFVGAGNYVVEVSGATSDKTVVTGTAALSGTVQVVPLTRLTTRTTYTILSGSPLAGTFGSATVQAGNNFARNPVLAYVGGDVLLTLDPGLLTPLLSGAATPNQRSVASGIDNAITAGNAMSGFDPLFSLSAAQLPGALDQLSGEVHASTASVLADESLYARSAILGRLRQASYGGNTSMAALSMGGPQVAFADEAIESALAYAKSPVVKAPMRAPAATSDIVFWAQGFGAWGRFDGDGNAATVRRDLAGFFTGIDASVAGNGRVGIAAGYTGSNNNLDGRGSANVETGHIAGYGGGRFGAFSLRAGGDFAFHSIATDRAIVFPGFFDRTFANYDGHTGQIFGELGYGFALANVAIEPFAGAAWVRVKTDAAAERGGAAALNVAGTTFETGYTTLGIRAASLVPIGHDMILIPRGTLAWQHAFDNVTPNAVLAFQTAPATPFTISGVPIGRDALLAEAGLDLAIGRNATVGVSYTGQLARNVTDHAAKGRFSWRF